MTKPIQASDHRGFWAWTIAALLIPILGFVAGLVYVGRKKKVENKLGKHLLVISVLAFVVWLIIL